MGWEDRRHYGEGRGGGRFRAALSRMFGNGTNFFSWSFPVYRLWGITVRVHLVFVLVVIGELIRSAFGNLDYWGIGYMAMGMASLFGLVLLHEYGHCIACRLVGGEADEILLWPLGGLATCRPPHRWRAALVTTLGGPAVNLALMPILGGIVLLLTRQWGSVVFPPFDLSAAFGHVRLASSGRSTWWLTALWWLYVNNAMLFFFNMLLVMYPMDAGRVLQEVLWARIGYRESVRIAAKVGLVTAVCLGVFALLFNESILLGIAVFAGFTCYSEIRRMMFESEGGLPGYDFERGYRGMPGAEERNRDSRSQRKRQEREQAAQAELDRILEKIAKQGMGSLTSREKRALGQETDRRRRG